MKKLATKLLIAALTLPLSSIVLASEQLDVYPPSWWSGMQHNSVQLMVYGKGIGLSKASSQSLDITGSHRLDSDNYLFIDINTEYAEPGDYTITFTHKDKTISTLRYTLNARKSGSAQRTGFSQKDTIYLITPDRFANGDPSNDTVKGYADLPGTQ